MITHSGMGYRVHSRFPRLTLRSDCGTVSVTTIYTVQTPHTAAFSSYPDNNCGEIYAALGPPKDPQIQFPSYLNHSMGASTIAPYLNSTRIAQEAGKPFIMFETNTASCGGFSGISTSFGAALWAIDYGLEMAASNFSHALLHVGGQNVYYNVCLLSPQRGLGELTCYKLCAAAFHR